MPLDTGIRKPVMRRIRTPEFDDKVIELYKVHGTTKLVANDLKVSDETVRRVLIDHDVPRKCKREKPKPKILVSHCKTKYCPVVIEMLYVVGKYTTSDISRFTNIPITSVCNILRKRCGDAFISKQSNSRKADVDAIEREYRAGATTYELSEKYRVHHATISKWMRKRGIRKGKGNKLSTSVVKTCPRCGKKFLTRYRDKTYCSKTCQNAVNWHKRNDVLRSSGDGDFITLREVYKRDKGRCYICGKKTDWNDFRVVNGYKVVGNLYPTREHVVALHNGGTHTWDNVRLACHRCNSAKSDKGQMRIAI